MHILLVKARIKGDDKTFDLFDMPVRVEAYTRKDGTPVKAHTEVRKVRKEEEKPIPKVVAVTEKPVQKKAPTKDIPDFSNPETYKDSDIERIARFIARTRFDDLAAGKMGRGEFKERVLRGEFHEPVREKWQEEKTQSEKMAQGHADADNISYPSGYSITHFGNAIILHGPFNEDLHSRLKRLGGQWLPAGDKDNPKSWSIPAEKGKSLQKLFGNSEKTNADLAEKKNVAEIKRWLGYVTEKVSLGYVYQKGVDKLRELGIDNHPELKEKLTSAIEQARQAKAKQQEQYAKERQSRHEAREEKHKAVAGSRVLYPLSNSPQLNAPRRLGSNVVVFTGHGEPFRISEDHPSTHGSHLLGHEGDKGAYFYFRPATDKEREQLEKLNEQAANSVARTKSLNSLKDEISSKGEQPERMNLPDGEKVHNTQTISGGGDWFVIGKDWIWYVRNNGADGDDWSQNNVRTGGAGAIGWRVPYTKELADKIRNA